MSESTFLSVFEGVPVFDIKMGILLNGVTISNLSTKYSHVFSTKVELRRLVEGGGFSLNKEKINSTEIIVGRELLLNKKYLLVQKGKKSYYIIRVKWISFSHYRRYNRNI
jgi:tyrosyl-tRNA synthetase